MALICSSANWLGGLLVMCVQHRAVTRAAIGHAAYPVRVGAHWAKEVGGAHPQGRKIGAAKHAFQAVGTSTKLNAGSGCPGKLAGLKAAERTSASPC